MSDPVPCPSDETAYDARLEHLLRRWQDGEFRDREVYEVLGMNEADYHRWVADPSFRPPLAQGGDSATAAMLCAGFARVLRERLDSVVLYGQDLEDASPERRWMLELRLRAALADGDLPTVAVCALLLWHLGHALN